MTDGKTTHTHSNMHADSGVKVSCANRRKKDNTHIQQDCQNTKKKKYTRYNDCAEMLWEWHTHQLVCCIQRKKLKNLCAVCIVMKNQKKNTTSNNSSDTSTANAHQKTEACKNIARRNENLARFRNQAPEHLNY